MPEYIGAGRPTFSCFRCFSSFSSRYVRLARTGVLKGFMIFLMATFWLVSWSRAELQATTRQQLHRGQDGGRIAYQTRPNAPMPTGWRSEYRDVISNVVPKIWARTNSAMVGDGILCGIDLLDGGVTRGFANTKGVRDVDKDLSAYGCGIGRNRWTRSGQWTWVLSRRNSAGARVWIVLSTGRYLQDMDERRISIGRPSSGGARMTRIGRGREGRRTQERVPGPARLPCQVWCKALGGSVDLPSAN